MKYEILRELQRRMKEDADSFAMCNWIASSLEEGDAPPLYIAEAHRLLGKRTGNKCGTTACIAGEAIIIALERQECQMVNGGLRFLDGSFFNSFQAAAAYYLELPNEFLFFQEDWDLFWMQDEDSSAYIADGVNMAEAIDHYIAYNTASSRAVAQLR